MVFELDEEEIEFESDELDFDDFPAIYETLTSRGFEGWITMDFDPPRAGAGTIEENIAVNKRYLVRRLGVEL